MAKWTGFTLFYVYVKFVLLIGVWSNYGRKFQQQYIILNLINTSKKNQIIILNKQLKKNTLPKCANILGTIP